MCPTSSRTSSWGWCALCQTSSTTASTSTSAATCTQVCHNKVINFRRKLSGHADEDADLSSLEDARAAAQLEEVWEQDHNQFLARLALELMQAEFQPTTWKACWELVVEDRPAAEVAAELGMTENAVFVAKCRVLGRLRKELTGLIDE